MPLANRQKRAGGLEVKWRIVNAKREAASSITILQASLFKPALPPRRYCGYKDVWNSLQSKEGCMRRTILAVLFLCLIALPGLAAGDVLDAIFRAKDSDQADLNRGNPKSRSTATLPP